MSSVTNIIVTSSIFNDDPQLLESVNEKLKQYGFFVNVAKYATSYKVVEAQVWLGAFNYLDLGVFLDAIHAVPWEDPEDLRIFIQRQCDNSFSCLEISVPSEPKSLKSTETKKPEPSTRYVAASKKGIPLYMSEDQTEIFGPDGLHLVKGLRSSWSSVADDDDVRELRERFLKMDFGDANENRR